jgi:hypothetical protein
MILDDASPKKQVDPAQMKKGGASGPRIRMLRRPGEPTDHRLLRRAARRRQRDCNAAQPVNKPVRINQPASRECIAALPIFPMRAAPAVITCSYKLQ